MLHENLDKNVDQNKIEEDFSLAFKLVFFDENNEEIEPPEFREIRNLFSEAEI